MSKNAKGLLTIVLIVGGIAAMLYGLAKLGGGIPSSNGEPQSLATEVSTADHSKGPANAPVTLVEYSDFQCPACKAYESSLKQLATQYDQELKIVYRHFPLTSIHKNAQLAAQASEAAALQGKFWEYHDVLFNTQDRWEGERNPEGMFVEYAKSLGLDEERFKKDLNSDEVKKAVKEDAESAMKAGVNATPTFFLNGKFLEAPNNYEQFSAYIVEQLIITGNNEVGNTASSTK